MFHHFCLCRCGRRRNAAARCGGAVGLSFSLVFGILILSFSTILSSVAGELWNF